jgi:DNA-binding transcriptional LysR family regulator
MPSNAGSRRSMPDRHTKRVDVVGACRAFVSVSERGSFTLGAAAARVPQSVASRRVAALEKHLGEALFDRSSRSVTLTAFGRDMLPSARRLVRLAEEMEHDAERAKRSPFRLAVPQTCGTLELAALDVEARRRGIYLDFHPAGPTERAELVRSLEVRAALMAVPPSEAIWSVPLGVAGVTDPRTPSVHLESLRTGRAQSSSSVRRVWIQPEDDVPHVRDRLTRLGDAVALRPAQVSVAGTLTGAVAEVLGSADFLLCSPAQAEELALHWRPVGEIELVRGFDVAAGIGTDLERIRTSLREPIARCLGVPEFA